VLTLRIGRSEVTLKVIMLTKKQIQNGFTIVELLIVIVIIGILAAIVTVAYNGIQNRAKNTQADVLTEELMTKSKTYRSLYDRYPTYDELVNNRIPGSPDDNSADQGLNLGADLKNNLTSQRGAMQNRQKLLVYRNCDQAAISAYRPAGEEDAGAYKKTIIADNEAKRQSADTYCL